jgi:hypothetical protein
MPSLRQNSLPLSLRSVVVEFVTLKIYATGGSLVLKFPSSYGPVHLDLATKVYVLHVPQVISLLSDSRGNGAAIFLV